jgi:hypothetical protein
MLRAGRSGVRIPAETTDLSLIQNVMPGVGAYPASCSMDTVCSYPGKRRKVSEVVHVLLVSRIKLSGAIPLLPLCIFMVWEERTVRFTWCSYVIM